MSRIKGMTREKAIEILRKRQRCCKVIAEYANETVKADELREIEAIGLALAALLVAAYFWAYAAAWFMGHRH